MAGPAPGLPNEAEWWIRYSRRGAFRIEEAWNFCPAIAVPMIVKIPEPMTAPMPSDVRLSHPRDFFNRTSAFSQSDSSWSMLLLRKCCDPTHALRSHSGKPKTRSYPIRLWGINACLNVPRDDLSRNLRAHSAPSHVFSVHA